MKRSFSLALSVLLLCSMLCMLGGCHKEDPQIIGTWQAEIDYADVVNDVLNSSKPVKSFLLPTTFTFLSDGTYTIDVDTGKIMFMIFQSDYMIGQLADRLGTQIRGHYRAEDSKLYMTTDMDTELTDTNYDIYKIEGDTLTLSECHCHKDEGFKNIPRDLYPISLTRVAE